MFPYFIFALTIFYVGAAAFQLFVRNDFGVSIALFCAAAAILYVGVDAR